MNRNYTLSLTTLTPVCIGTGYKLSPYADFVIDPHKKKIFYINQEGVKHKLALKPSLINEYVKGIENGMNNNRSDFELKTFLKSNLGIDIEKENRLVLDCEAQGKKELYTIVKNAGLQPYIPGSSLKGAVMTAIVYDHLLNGEGKQCVEQTLLNPSKGLEMLSEHIEQVANRYNPAFADSSLSSPSSMKCIDNKRLHISKGSSIVPQVWEAIKPNSTMTMTYSSASGPAHSVNELPWHELRRVLNQFAKDANDREWDLLSDCAGEDDSLVPIDMYESLSEFYEQMEETIENAPADTAYVKLGAGKGYYYNSIGLALYKADGSENKEGYLRFLKAVGFGKIYSKETRKMESYDLDPMEFPITRVLDFTKTLPLGWIKIKLNK